MGSGGAGKSDSGGASAGEVAALKKQVDRLIAEKQQMQVRCHMGVVGFEPATVLGRVTAAVLQLVRWQR